MATLTCIKLAAEFACASRRFVALFMPDTLLAIHNLNIIKSCSFLGTTRLSLPVISCCYDWLRSVVAVIVVLSFVMYVVLSLARVFESCEHEI